eukprot:CAMPEP_0184320772 /NCGR_PEP_ID=MMETSP1049-20130417/115712_1 /TAXON_ID=77928 /ORGANISM="Proteomonas sulcata, Strain CCMP704" /LENGTH=53 /DNA_ID=CAMNT_0026641371 /DNA_START=51 /DNA_END=212 /DNA_ORIENTATION=-
MGSMANISCSAASNLREPTELGLLLIIVERKSKGLDPFPLDPAFLLDVCLWWM